MAELIEAGDAALATPLLRQHFDRYAKEPGELQARTLLKRLGVMLRNGQLVVDDAAARQLRSSTLNSRCRDAHAIVPPAAWSEPERDRVSFVYGHHQIAWCHAVAARCTSSCASSARSVSVATRGVA